jgi:hypothetical protein
LREDAADQYLAYKLIESNQDWKAKWFYISNHHPVLPKPSGNQSKHRLWWNTEPMMQQGIQLLELLKKIKALREAGLRAEHVAFSFMKRRVQPFMALDILGYQYRDDEDTSRMPLYTSCPVPEYSAACPPSKVSSRDRGLRVLICLMYSYSLMLCTAG